MQWYGRRVMSTHPNALRIRRLFDAFHHGDLATIQEMIPEAAVWYFPGRRGQLAGEHRGRDAVLAFLMKVQALTNHSFHLDLVDVLANDENAVVLFRGRGERDGKTLDNPTCLRRTCITSTTSGPDHTSNVIRRAFTRPSAIVRHATLTGNRKRRGPALPGFTTRTPSRLLTSGR